MGATHLNAKGNIDTKTSRRRAGGGWFFSFGACFGLYVSSSHKKHKKNLYDDPVHIHDHHGGDFVESVKYGKKRPNSAESNVIPPSQSIKGIQIVAAAASPPLLLQASETSFDQGTILEERSKIKQEQSTDTVNVRDIWSDPTGPAPPRRRQEKTAAGKTVNKDETTSAASEFDSVVGALIMTLTLAVMLIWGKICAIFCSAAWVLFIYCLKQNNESFGRKNDQICDLDSHEYKKRVVLQGLLERM